MLPHDGSLSPLMPPPSTPPRVQVTSQYALGTLWEGWQNSQGEGGSSMNHAFMGGGIGEWFYEFALGLRYRHRRPPQAAAAPPVTETRCAVPSTLSDALVSHRLRLTDAEVCALASVVAESEGGRLPNMSRLRAAARAALHRKPPTPATAGAPLLLAPEASLVLDGRLLPALRSAQGHLDTVYGRLAASWRWDGSTDAGSAGDASACPRLSALISSPAAVRSAVFVHRELLEAAAAAAGCAPRLTLTSPGGITRTAAVTQLLGVAVTGSNKSAAADSLAVPVSWVGGAEVYEQGNAEELSGRWLRVQLSFESDGPAPWKLQIGR